MKILLWEIKLERNRYAKLQWTLFKLFGIKPKTSCGCGKAPYANYCHLCNFEV